MPFEIDTDLFSFRVKPGQEGFKKAPPAPPAFPSVADEYRRFIEPPKLLPPPAPQLTPLPSFEVLPPFDKKPVTESAAHQLERLLRGGVYSSADYIDLREKVIDQQTQQARSYLQSYALGLFAFSQTARYAPIPAKVVGHGFLAVEAESAAEAVRLKPTPGVAAILAPSPLGIIPPEKFGLAPDYLRELLPFLPEKEFLSTATTPERKAEFILDTALRARGEQLQAALERREPRPLEPLLNRLLLPGQPIFVHTPTARELAQLEADLLAAGIAIPPERFAFGPADTRPPTRRDDVTWGGGGDLFFDTGSNIADP